MSAIFSLEMELTFVQVDKVQDNRIDIDGKIQTHVKLKIEKNSDCM